MLRINRRFRTPSLSVICHYVLPVRRPIMLRYFCLAICFPTSHLDIYILEELMVNTDFLQAWFFGFSKIFITLFDTAWSFYSRQGLTNCSNTTVAREIKSSKLQLRVIVAYRSILYSWEQSVVDMDSRLICLRRVPKTFVRNILPRKVCIHCFQ